MSIWEKLGFGGYRGFSREAEQLLQQAVELAGSFGCSQADTGHLLLAMLQQEQGAAARFLNSRHISEQAVRRQLAENRRGPAQHLDRHAMAPDLRRTMDYALIGAQNAHVSRAEPEHLLCAMLEDDGCAAGLLLVEMGLPLTEAVRECRQLSGQFVLPVQPRVSASIPGQLAAHLRLGDLSPGQKLCRSALLLQHCQQKMAGIGLLTAQIACQLHRLLQQPHCRARKAPVTAHAQIFPNAHVSAPCCI